MANLEVNLDRLTSDTILRAAAVRLDRADKTTIYRAWANYLEGEIVNAFAAERAPNGQAWAALKPATVTRKRNRKTSPRSKNKILQDTGALYDSIYARVEGDGVIAGSNLKVGAYSLGAIHQFGAPRRNIPARPFMPLDAQGDLLPQTREDLADLVRDYLANR